MIRLVILDLDGTVYRGNDPTPGAIEAITGIRRRNVHVRFLTNNSSSTPQNVVAKLATMGISADESEVLTSAMVAADMVARSGAKRVYLIGEPGLADCCRNSGLEVIGMNEDSPMEQTGAADAVIVGICWTFNYTMLDNALQHLLKGAKLFCTNGDSTYPIEGGGIKPGAGSIVAAVERVSGQKAEVIGKPNPLMVKQLLAETGCKPEEALVVGDRYETDIECGLRAGCKTLMVMTGVTQSAPEGVAWGADIRSILDYL